VALQPECQFLWLYPQEAGINPKFETRNSARSEASALNNDQNAKVPMTKTAACYCVSRKYLFGAFSHLTFEFVSNFDIRYSDFETVVFSLRAKLDHSIGKADGFWI
jgi:hypothetical protein